MQALAHKLVELPKQFKDRNISYLDESLLFDAADFGNAEFLEETATDLQVSYEGYKFWNDDFHSLLIPLF